jgi:hypothetical protein
MSHQIAQRRFQFNLRWIFVMTALAALAAWQPLKAIAVGFGLPLMALGIACSRSAVVNRLNGWRTGLLFGAMLFLIGASLSCGLAILFAVEFPERLFWYWIWAWTTGP